MDLVVHEMGKSGGEVLFICIKDFKIFAGNSLLSIIRKNAH